MRSGFIRIPQMSLSGLYFENFIELNILESMGVLKKNSTFLLSQVLAITTANVVIVCTCELFLILH